MVQYKSWKSNRWEEMERQLTAAAVNRYLQFVLTVWKFPKFTTTFLSKNYVKSTYSLLSWFHEMFLKREKMHHFSALWNFGIILISRFYVKLEFGGFWVRKSWFHVKSKRHFFFNFYTVYKCKEDFMIDLGYAWLIGANDVNWQLN